MILYLNLTSYLNHHKEILCPSRKTIKKPSICLINARSCRSYIGVYDGSKAILKDQVMKNEDVLEYIKNHKEYVICGDCGYLNLEGYKNDKCLNMLALKSSITPTDSFHVKPIYLKD